MVVGICLPEIGSGIVLGTSISRPSTFTLIFSITDAGLFSVIAVVDILMRGRQFMPFGRRGRGGFYLFLGAAFLVGFAFGDEFVLELPNKTLHGPRTGFAESANRAAIGNVV